MSTRSTTHFVTGEGTGAHSHAIVYRHSDGYPDGAGIDIRRFFRAVEEDTSDTRFSDPSYLAAKYVVWLADKFHDVPQRVAEITGGDLPPETGKLDFLSVGVCLQDPGDIEYRYIVHCDKHDVNGHPEIECLDVMEEGRSVAVPDIPLEEAEPRPEEDAFR